MHRKDQGKLGESLVLAQVLRSGCNAFIDFGDNSKIDLIVEDTSGKLHRVQVKCPGREKKTPNCSVLSMFKNGPGYRYKYVKGDVDWFAVVDLETDQIAWVSAAQVFASDLSSISLRHTPCKNGQTKRVNMFKDYTEFPFQ